MSSPKFSIDIILGTVSRDPKSFLYRPPNIEEHSRMLSHAMNCPEAVCDVYNPTICRAVRNSLLHFDDCQLRREGRCRKCAATFGAVVSHILCCEDSHNYRPCRVPWCELFHVRWRANTKVSESLYGKTFRGFSGG
ncbi:hypothetical protein QR680_013587 [Steinernema hermaphroditum]|uniref:TAZ-type domain-containing protein n=1 Tax=Steinernema hermaphroditum TaxID=289476 RepID=A0AA39M2T1_9BILA|nr:hypothetical protein QR680_013587 [Steinernema hermaphroditum]